MNPVRSLLALIALSTLLVVGCKDSPTGSDNSGRSQLLIKSWKTVTVTANGFDARESYADVTTFLSGGTYTVTYPASPPEQGTWQLSSDNTKLTMDAGHSSEGVWTIIELTSTKLHMTAQLNVLGSLVAVDYTGVPN